jgi:DNA-binding response OmpR family regulator
VGEIFDFLEFNYMPKKILIVEDEQSLVETLEYNLAREGYRVETARDGEVAIESARNWKPDLLVLDIMLPRIDGFEVCRILRKETNTPILMLTARDEEIDRVVGLEMGADDYLTKPFSMREFLARVKALLRRVRLDREDAAAITYPETTTYTFGDLEVDVSRREINLRGNPLTLKPKEFDLLLYLAQHPGQVLSRELILEKVWGWSFSGGSRTVDVHIRWLREKIEPNPEKPARFVTVRGSGYRFDG